MSASSSDIIGAKINWKISAKGIKTEVIKPL